MMCVMPWPATADSSSSRLVTSPWLNWPRDISSSLRRARRRWDSASRSNTHGLSLRSTRFLTIQAPMNPFAPVIRNRAPVALAGVARVMLAHYMFWGRSVNATRSEEHTSELQSLAYLVCRLLLEKKKKNQVQTFLLCEL